jgi:hypothetical protein
MDTSGDGTLTKHELQAGLEANGVSLNNREVGAARSAVARRRRWRPRSPVRSSGPALGAPRQRMGLFGVGSSDPIRCAARARNGGAPGEDRAVCHASHGRRAVRGAHMDDGPSHHDSS